MKVKVLGIQPVDYVSKKTGQPVVGVSYHVSYSDAQVGGMAVDKIYVSDNLDISCRKDIKVGSTIDVIYNNRGYVCDIELVKTN